MTVHHRDNRVTVHHGDALDVLATLEDNSIDAVITDPLMRYRQYLPLILQRLARVGLR